jgi:CO dehydrogenase maturation factor
MKALILERTGAQDSEFSAFFKLNPHVSDLPERLCVEHKGVRLLVLGAVHKGGGGCACPENAFLRALMSHIVLQRDEVVIADMEAGIEHLGRATVEGVDALIVVIEPGQWSVNTALGVRKLAQDIGIRRILAVGNKVGTETHVDFMRKALGAIPLLGVIPYSERLAQAGLGTDGIFAADSEAVDAVRKIKEKVEEVCKNVKRKT